MVIEHLSALCELSAGAGITFVYCNYKESQTTTAYIRLALKQLCRTMQSLPPQLQEIYEEHYRNDCQPKYDELRNIFLEIIQQLGCVFFMVDALDECTLNERKGLCKFLLSITDTGTSQGTVKLFAGNPILSKPFNKKLFVQLRSRLQKLVVILKYMLKPK